MTTSGKGNGLNLQLLAQPEKPVLEKGPAFPWDLSFLADNIVNTHHAFLHEKLEEIAVFARKVAGVYGANHPEVIEIANIFGKIATDMDVVNEALGRFSFSPTSSPLSASR